MKPVIPLEKPEPLAEQVAGHLLAGRTEKPIDLGDTLVLIPTAGAGRAIRRELSKKGVLSPQFRLPMDALVPSGIPVASRLEREAAWALLLDPAKRKTFASLIPGAVPLDTPDDRFGVAARLCNVCDQLAEAGLDPLSPKLLSLKELSEDTHRWTEFGELYAEYLKVLSKHGLRDPNDVRLEQAKNPVIPNELKRVVVACIPDLAPVVETYLHSLEKEGITIDVLAWSPADQAKHLDVMGRPDKEWCGGKLLRVEDDTIVPANDPPTEAGFLLDFVAQQSDADFEVFAAAPESAVALAQEIAWRDAESYLPEGRGLAQTESAEILLGWDEFAAGRRLRDLRVLLQKPAFLAFLVAQVGKAEKFTAQHALEACDHLIGQRLCETVSSARSWLKHFRKSAEKKSSTFYAQEDLANASEKLLARKLDGRGMLAAVSEHRGTVEAGSFAAKELAAIAEVTGQFENSALLRELPEDMRRSAAKVDILRKRIFPRASAEAIEVQGWLEAPWSSAKTLVIAGCREGALPSGTYDDPFLPDKAKDNLGLVTQDKRLARDAYLLSCLLSSRPAAQVRLGFSRFRNQGEPNRPSRLLFSCDNSELPKRSQTLLKPAPRSKRADANKTDFKLSIPRPKKFPPDTIRVTAFKSYLECPLRFYLGNILGLRKVDPNAREIPATDFGIVIHKVLERFVLDKSLRELSEAEDIAGKLSAMLDEVAPQYYGTTPSPVVRVQIENMRSRLMAAATTEARIRSEGWETIAAEHQVKKEDGRELGGLLLTGTMDRVDRHPEKGLRILDYKTFSDSKKQNPAYTHIGPHRGRKHLPEADFEILTANGDPRPRSWLDLQLPLYAWLAKKIWPDDAAKGIQVGYFLLPPDAEPGAISLKFLELTGEMQTSAEECAGRIAQLVKGGNFWPPSPSSEVEYDDYKDWFMEGDPQKLIDDESACWLNGNP